MPREDIHIEVLSDPRWLAAVRALVRCYVRSLGFTAERTDEIVLAMDEACSNSMRHAYGAREGLLDLSLRSDEACVEFVLRDEGAPARADRIQRKELSAVRTEELRPGGLGVQLMFQIFDDVEFSAGEEKGNRVIMRLNRPDPGR